MTSRKTDRERPATSTYAATPGIPAAYAPPRPRGPIDLQLSRNEGRCPRGLSQPQLPQQELARYPDLAALRRELAGRWGLPPERALLTAGGDDVLLRCCLASAASPGGAVLATPTFEMIPRYLAMANVPMRCVPWPEGPFPTDALIEAGRDAAIAFVVTPNNPTGAVASPRDVERIARALPDTLVVLDAAYGELATNDPTPAALALPNVVVVRTLSKAWGLAGLRVGYALGSAAWIARLAAVGNPYPVSSASAALARTRLATGEEDMRAYAERVADERADLSALLTRLGARPAAPTEANFVLARELDPQWTVEALAALGIAVRAFPGNPELADAVRITVPGEAPSFTRLCAALTSALAPAALIFDLDGVLADVSESYRVAIVETAAAHGVSLSNEEVAAAKRRGGANDDWELTRALLAAHGVDVPLDEVTRTFEALYQGTQAKPGLREREQLCVSRPLLVSLKERWPLAIVTGRPRSDAQGFLERFNLQGLFRVVICREDAALKPDPAPVRLALERLGLTRASLERPAPAWMLGDTVDDVVASRAAGVLPLGVLPPGEADPDLPTALLDAGAARVLDRTDALEGLLP